MELNLQQKTDVINTLSKADGEDIQYILEKIGMDDQILKQLVNNATELALFNALNNRFANN